MVTHQADIKADISADMDRGEATSLMEPLLIGETSWHRGAPRSRPGPNGMPWLPGKEGAAQRQQVHVLIQFPCEVRGPLLLGAGRFRGYGLCKPLGHRPQ